MKIRLAILAVLMALVAGCDDGKIFLPKEVTVIIIDRNLRRDIDEYTSIASKEYRLDWKERAITFRCPCFLGSRIQGKDYGGSVAVIKEGEMKVELLPEAAYDIDVDESGKNTHFSFPMIGQ